MFIELTDAQLRLRDELRAYFATLVTPAERAALAVDSHGEMYEEIIARMGRDGWLGLGWPVEYGGRGYGAVEQQIFVSEAVRADVPYPVVTLQTVGPTLQRFGSPEQQRYFLPRILAGEVHFAIGYSEPDAGTDLASLRTRARREGDEYVIDGQKIYTTGAHRADYIWLACRTDPDAPRHKGISIFIVDTSSPGFSWTPIITMDGRHHTNSTYYESVRVPVSNRVGAENTGWRMITTQLNHERVTLGPSGKLARFYDRVRDWANHRYGPDGTPLAELPEVARALAEAYAYIELNQLLNWQVAAASNQGELAAADASATKVFSSERVRDVGRILGDVVARHGDPADPGTRELAEWLDRSVKSDVVLTFGGGVNEVQREIIATMGLGLPRAPR